MRLSIFLSLAALTAAVAPASAAAQEEPPYVPGEVVVQYEGAPAPTVVPVASGDTVPEATSQLNAQANVQYAVPNVIAHASGFVPDDPGRGGRTNWQRIQWNVLGPVGVNAPDAWSYLIAARRPGGRGVTVGALDTGVAYRTTKRFRR